MQKVVSGAQHGRGPARSDSTVAALFGAAFTVVALTGIVAIAGSPQSLSDVAQFPVSAETFEVTPAGGHDPAPHAYALAPATGYVDPGLQVSYDVYA
jgi:hypothetical protein